MIEVDVTVMVEHAAQEAFRLTAASCDSVERTSATKGSISSAFWNI